MREAQRRVAPPMHGPRQMTGPLGSSARIRPWGAPGRRRFGWSTLLKLCVGAVAIAALLTYGWVSVEGLMTIAVHPTGVLLATLAAILALLLSAMRWFSLLRNRGFAWGFWPIARVSLAAGFLSILLPGSFGGDAARAIYVCRGATGRNAEALLTIVVDRACAVLGLLSAAALLLATRQDAWQPGHPLHQAGGYVLGALLMICAGAAAAIAWGSRLAQKRQAAGRGPGGRLAAVLAQVLDFAVGLRRSPLLILGIVALSALSSLCGALSIVFLGTSLVPRFPVGDLALAGVLANVASALPVSPGGIGVGEAAFAAVCRLIDPIVDDPAPYASIYLAFRFVAMLPGLLGVAGYVIWDLEGHETPDASR